MKQYFGIRVSQIQKGYVTPWTIIPIKAYNYHEAKNKLKEKDLYEDYYLIPHSVLQHREIIKANKYFKEVI